MTPGVGTAFITSTFRILPSERGRDAHPSRDYNTNEMAPESL